MQRLIELQILTKKQRRLSWISSSEVKKEGEYLYFVGCLPYFDIIFQENGVAALSIAKCTIRILNELGIEPALLEDEKCCGHDFLYSGDIRKFKALARSNLDAIKRAGAKKVIFSCPECYHMFNQVYPRYFKIDFEVISMVQFLSENLPKFNKMEKNLTLQDSCRLSRFERLYEQPRKILNAIPGVNFLEMKQNREESICCGSSTWTNCFNCSRRLQLERLNEAASTGADVLVTTCPKCQIHFRCAMQGNSFQFEIKDIISLVAESMRR
jgi:Fe-S oxidoreductase